MRSEAAREACGGKTGSVIKYCQNWRIASETHQGVPRGRVPGIPSPGRQSMWALILAGGVSRRMGRSKQDLPFGAGTLLERTVAVAREFAEEVVLVGDDAAASRLGLRAAQDWQAGAGPLSGLAGGLAACPEGQHALLACDLLIDLFPDYREAHAYRTTILMKLGRHDEALRHAGHLLQQWPDDAETTYNMACLLSIQGGYADALGWLEKAIATNAPYKDQAKTDDDLVGLREHADWAERFAALVND